MAGISEAVVVIEAGEKSGTLITSRLALDYNKNIGAVPGDIFSPLSMETNRLIRNGATPITCSEDILEILGLY
jgi:DNA processing protein